MRPRILVFDRGAFLPFAMALSGDADVAYFSEWRDIASASRNAMVGRDVPGITRVDSFWKALPAADVIAFPDVGDGDLQTFLRDKGYAVWGTGDAELMELDRSEFQRMLTKLDLPTIDTRQVIGLDALEAILREEDDLYLKTSWFRYDLETRHHANWRRSRMWLAKLRWELGPHGDEIEILVQKPLRGKEIGYEGYTIDGMFPPRCAWGVELKDSSYLGMAVDAEDLPSCLQEANEVLAEPLRRLGARGNYHNELRIADDGTAYISDPCLRCGSPPFGALSLWVSNWPEIVERGAHGEMTTPSFTAIYACEIEMRSEDVQDGWLAVDIPEEAEPWVRLRRACMIEGGWWSIPSKWLDIIGSAVGLGGTPQAAIRAAIAIAEQVEADGLEWNRQVEDDLLEAWEDAQSACAQTPAVVNG